MNISNLTPEQSTPIIVQVDEANASSSGWYDMLNPDAWVPNVPVVSTYKDVTYGKFFAVVNFEGKERRFELKTLPVDGAPIQAVSIGTFHTLEDQTAPNGKKFDKGHQKNYAFA